MAMLKPIQDRFYELSKDKAYIDNIIKNNAEKASIMPTEHYARFKRR